MSEFIKACLLHIADLLSLLSRPETRGIPVVGACCCSCMCNEENSAFTVTLLDYLEAQTPTYI